MVDPIGIVSDWFGGINWVKIFSYIAWTVILIVIMIAVAIGLYFYFVNKKFNKNIVIFEKINNRFEPVSKDVAMEVKFGSGGDTIFRLKKYKKHLPRPTIQTGINTYWYVIREDGEWINIGCGDIDLQMKEMKVRYLDKEMRYNRTALQKALAKEFEDKSWWARNKDTVATIAVIAIIFIFMLLLFQKFLAVSSSLNAAIESAREVMDLARESLVSVDNIRSGSGIVQMGG